MRDIIHERMVKFYAKSDKHITVNATTGHFATSQSHVNFYIDVTRLKTRVSEATDAARSICQMLLNKVVEVDTIVCLDDSQVLGTLLAQQMEKADFRMQNLHETMYVVSPVMNSMQQLMFTQNTTHAITGKNVLILSANITTGASIRQAFRTVKYYGGSITGVAAIFCKTPQIDEYPVYSLFTAADFPDYQTYFPNECPYCAKNMPIEAMVSGTGYTLM